MGIGSQKYVVENLNFYKMNFLAVNIMCYHIGVYNYRCSHTHVIQISQTTLNDASHPNVTSSK
jgi:hypothetical protein